jgi:DNA-binding CsgD family transcriptional regulator
MGQKLELPMVQTNQKLSFLTSQRKRDTEEMLVRLHEVNDIAKLAKVTFELIEACLPYKFLILLFRPLEFELPCRFFPLKYKALVDQYMAETHKEDIWLQRSPINPQVTVVRHSDYTPQKLLHRSAFYRKLLRPNNTEYGASVVAWRDNTWLATLTLMRTKEQGEFSDGEMQELQALQPHFACVIRRMAGHQETRLVHSSLRHFMASLPTANLILDWNLKVLHFNSIASHLCSQWKRGARGSPLKDPRRFQVPGDILAEIERMRPSIMSQRFGRYLGHRKPLLLNYRHPSMPSLSASIEFLPSRSLSLSKGTFLVTLEEDHSSHRGLDLSHKLNQLTRRERECALLAAEGLHNGDIAKRLGKSQITVRNQLSSIYKKLGIDSRSKLIAALAQIDKSQAK